ncbi:MAG: site-specific integrase, partial [Terracidiphilus sp.]
MANRTASLIINAKLDNGWRRGKLVVSKNGKYKPGVMHYNGKEVPYSEGVYQIRHYDGNRLVYKTVGKDYLAADTMLSKLQVKLRRDADNAILGIKPETEPKEQKTLAECVEDYLEKKQRPSLGLGYSAIHQYKQALNTFLQVAKAKYVADVTEQDVTACADEFLSQGYSRKSIAMRYTTIRGFLAAHGVVLRELIDTATHRKLSSKPDPSTEPYTPKE